MVEPRHSRPQDDPPAEGNPVENVVALLQGMDKQTFARYQHMSETSRKYGLHGFASTMKGVHAGLVHILSDFREAFEEPQNSDLDSSRSRDRIASWLKDYRFPDYIAEAWSDEAQRRLVRLRQRLVEFLEGNGEPETDLVELGGKWVRLLTRESIEKD